MTLHNYYERSIHRFYIRLLVVSDAADLGIVVLEIAKVKSSSHKVEVSLQKCSKCDAQAYPRLLLPTDHQIESIHVAPLQPEQCVCVSVSASPFAGFTRTQRLEIETPAQLLTSARAADLAAKTSSTCLLSIEFRPRFFVWTIVQANSREKCLMDNLIHLLSNMYSMTQKSFMLLS